MYRIIAGRTSRPEQLASFLFMTAWFGLLAGLAEVSLLAVEKFLLHHYVHQGPQVVWMAPLADLLLVATSGLFLVLLARRWPRLAGLPAVAFLFAFLGLLSLLFMIAWLETYAALLLAVGLAVQTARSVAARARGFSSLVRHTTPLLVALVVALAVGVQGWQGLAERRALAKLPLPPAPPDAPNVLLIVLDTVRAQSLSLYGYARPTTPRLERLARAGVRFDRAIAPAPWTLPSHASMFTGRVPNELSANWRKPLDATYPTLAEVLSAHGYETAGFVANTVYCTVESGLSRGFAHYEDYLLSPGEIIRSSSLGRAFDVNGRLQQFTIYHQRLGRKSAPEVNDGFLRWLSARQQRRPFFAFINYFDAHAPYLPPPPYDVMFALKIPWREPRDPRDDALLSEKRSPLKIGVKRRNAYDGSIAYLDYHLGLLFDELQKRGVLANTLVIITSDHGEEFGEHGFIGHGLTLYWPSLHVPLVILFPSRVPAGKTVLEPVTLRDLPATMVDLLQLEGGARLPGTSLSRYWNGALDLESAAGEPLLSELSGLPPTHIQGPASKGNMRSLVMGRYHYIRNGDGREELYNFEADPWEMHDLAPSEEGRLAIARLRLVR